MKKLITLVIAATLLTGFSTAYGAAPAPLPVEGSWGVKMEQNGFTFEIIMKLENQTITTTNVCTYQGRSAVASVTVPAQYDASSITVLGNGQQDVNQNGLDCNVSVHPDRMNYVVAGSSLILSHEGSADQMVLTRK